MKKINTKQVLKNLKGEAMKSGEQEMTVGDVIAAVLSAKVTNPYLGFVLAKKFSQDKFVELKAEDVVFVKEELEKNGKRQDEGFYAIIIGQVIDILESSEDAK